MYAHQSIQIQMAIKVALLSKGNTKQTQRTQISKAIEQQQSFYIVRVNNRVRQKDRGEMDKKRLRRRGKGTLRERGWKPIFNIKQTKCKIFWFSSYCILLRINETDVCMRVCECVYKCVCMCAHSMSSIEQIVKQLQQLVYLIVIARLRGVFWHV